MNLMEVEAFRVPALIGLRSFNGSHKGIGNRWFVSGFRGRKTVERYADGQVECSELEAWKVRAAAGA